MEQAIQACEPEDDYESEEGIRLFFERLNAGWYVGADGRLKPPKNRLTLDQLDARVEVAGPVARRFEDAHIDGDDDGNG